MTKRPKDSDIEICLKVAAQLLPDVTSDVLEGADLEHSIRSIAEAIQYEDDGFRICRELENDGWDCDAEMVDVMNRAGMLKYEALQEATKAWVAAEGIAPALKVGDKVSVTVRGSPYIGTISAVNLDRASYTVFIPELGHVREGIGTHGTIVPYENCKEVASP